MTTQSSTPSNGRPMTFSCNLETFISMFDSETDALDHILLAHDDGRVETTQYTIPYYTYCRIIETPRFIAYGDHAPQLYSYEVRINATKCSDNDVVIEFPMADETAINWFCDCLHDRLSDCWGDYESEDVNITDEHMLERTALALQRELLKRRISTTRLLIQDSEWMNEAQFIWSCRDLVGFDEESKAALERIEHLDFIIEDRQLA